MILVCIKLAISTGQSIASVTKQYQWLMLVDGAVDCLFSLLRLGGAQKEQRLVCTLTKVALEEEQSDNRQLVTHLEAWKFEMQ